MVKLIGLSGYARSGKDTVGDYLVKHHGFVKVSFAEPMRQALLALNPYLQSSNAWIGEGVRLQDVIHAYGWDGYKGSFWGDDIRGLMQRFGTEVGRKQFGEDFWVDKASKLIDTYLWQDMNVVITDMRFVNEAKAVEALGGQTWRIERDGVVAANAHVSETALDTYGFDQLIRNDGSLDELYEKVEQTLGLI